MVSEKSTSLSVRWRQGIPPEQNLSQRNTMHFINAFKAIPHKARLTALHAICVQIFRHIAQKSLAIRQYACGISRQSDEKI
jgi:hypothetical protein